MNYPNQLDELNLLIAYYGCINANIQIARKLSIINGYESERDNAYFENNLINLKNIQAQISNKNFLEAYEILDNIQLQNKQKIILQAVIDYYKNHPSLDYDKSHGLEDYNTQLEPENIIEHVSIQNTNSSNSFENVVYSKLDSIVDKINEFTLPPLFEKLNLIDYTGLSDTVQKLSEETQNNRETLFNISSLANAVDKSLNTLENKFEVLNNEFRNQIEKLSEQFKLNQQNHLINDNLNNELTTTVSQIIDDNLNEKLASINNSIKQQKRSNFNNTLISLVSFTFITLIIGVIAGANYSKHLINALQISNSK